MNILRQVIEIDGKISYSSNLPFIDIKNISLDEESNTLSIFLERGSSIQEDIDLDSDNILTLRELEKDLVNYYIHLSQNNETLGFESFDKIFEIVIKKRSHRDDYKTVSITWEIKTNL